MRKTRIGKVGLLSEPAARLAKVERAGRMPKAVGAGVDRASL